MEKRLVEVVRSMACSMFGDSRKISITGDNWEIAAGHGTMSYHYLNAQKAGKVKMMECGVKKDR